MNSMKTYGLTLPAMALAAALGGIAPAHATLIIQDWKTAGDHLLVWDTTTNLEWLNWNVTTGKSFNQVSALLASDYAGFSYASTGQLNTLFVDAGITPFYPAPSVPLQNLVNLIGKTDPGNIPGASIPGYYGSSAITGTLDPYSPAYYLVANLTVNAGGSIQSYVNATGGVILPDGSNPIVGSALVRTYQASAVPLPPTAWMMGGGLMLLGLRMASRRRV